MKVLQVNGVRHRIPKIKNDYPTYLSLDNGIFDNMNSASSLISPLHDLDWPATEFDPMWMQSQTNDTPSTGAVNPQVASLSVDIPMLDAPPSTLTSSCSGMPSINNTPYPQMSDPIASNFNPPDMPPKTANTINLAASSGLLIVKLVFENAKPDTLGSILSTLYRDGVKYKMEVQYSKGPGFE